MMDTKEKAIEKLFYWKKGTAGSFATALFELICSADYENIERIRLGFPEVMEAYEEWFYSMDEEEFFKKYGFKL